jgi:hypothetical protein
MASGAASTFRAPSRNGRVKNASKLGQPEDCAASSSCTSYARE